MEQRLANAVGLMNPINAAQIEPQSIWSERVSRDSQLGNMTGQKMGMVEPGRNQIPSDQIMALARAIGGKKEVLPAGRDEQVAESKKTQEIRMGVGSRSSRKPENGDKKVLDVYEEMSRRKNAI